MAPTMDEIKDGTSGWKGLEVGMSGYHFHFAHTLKSAISNQQSAISKSARRCRKESISNYRGTFGTGRFAIAQHWGGYL